MRQHLSKAGTLLLTLLTTSCALIDWVDPIYEETAGTKTPYQIIFDANSGTGTMTLTGNSNGNFDNKRTYSKTDISF